MDELDWMTSFKYECLKNQITIRGVYIKGYATGGWEDYDLPEGAGFCVAIQDWLEARSQAVLAGDAKSSNGSCEWRFDYVVLGGLRFWVRLLGCRHSTFCLNFKLLSSGVRCRGLMH